MNNRRFGVVQGAAMPSLFLLSPRKKISMATATDLASSVDAAAVRRTLAKVTERLQALELCAEAWALREIALTGLRALSTVLFTDAHAEAGNVGVLAGLVAGEVGRISELLAATERHAAEVAAGTWRP
jgi:hypothetical protein